MGIFDKAAQSVLSGDRNKSAKHGGQLFDGVAQIDGNDETATLEIRMKSGGEPFVAMIGKYSDLINAAGKRATAPADVHDAVKATICDALGVTDKHE